VIQRLQTIAKLRFFDAYNHKFFSTINSQSLLLTVKLISCVNI